jgi:phytanoyl-CoA hydroxylase
MALHYMTEETCFVASGEHVMKPFIHVGDDETVQGEHFPIVWQKDRVLA